MNFQDIDAAASPEVQVNENFETIEYSSVYGKRQPVTTGLTWGYYGGRWAGFAVAEGTLALTNTATNYIVAKRSDGVISVSTASTNWDNVADYARVYKLTTAGGVVTAVEDHRAGNLGVHGQSPIVGIPTTTFTAKGSLIGASAANTPVEILVGSDGKVQMADPAQTSGLGYFPPAVAVGGRLTLSSATPVMIADVTGATTVYFAPYNGNRIPIYNGTGWLWYEPGELSQATTDSTKSPAAVGASSVYDLFVWNDSGTIRCTRGPAWSSDTARGTGAGTTELEMINGIQTNKVAITNGPGANRGTYVGSIRSNASSQIDWKLGSAAAGGGEAWLGVWNMYNRQSIETYTFDTVDSYTYQSATIRPSNNSNTNRISFLHGLAEDGFSARRMQLLQTSASVDQAVIGMSLDSTTAFAGNCEVVASATTANVQGYQTANFSSQPLLGSHFIQALEFSGPTAPATFYGDAGGTNKLQSFRGSFRM